MNFYYSKKLNKYISLYPLKIEKRVFDAAKKLDICLDWDDEGNICNIDFDDTKKLLLELGSHMLGVQEYFELYKEAKETNNTELLISLTSENFAEPLDRIYLSKDEYVDNPEIIGKYKYNLENKIKTQVPLGRPGWFNPDNVDNFGHPLNPNKKLNNKDWKYWSTDIEVTALGTCFALRGYVTSVANPSLDLGIPVDSKQPKQQIREVRNTPFEETLSSKEVKVIEDIINNQKIKEASEYIKSNRTEILKQIKNYFTYSSLEKLYDLSGEYILNNNLKGITLSYKDFKNFIVTREKELLKAQKENLNIVYVVGHRNPDTDTVISSIFEAYRNELIYPNSDTVYIPIVQSTYIPLEIKELLGEISETLILETNNVYKTNPLCRYILVDQNYQESIQKYVISIIDHHDKSTDFKNLNIPTTIKRVGSCTGLITTKFIGAGYQFDKELSKILYGSTLMDTENKVAHKMTKEDFLVMDYLKGEIKDSLKFYRELMIKLTSCKNIDELFYRDYKDFSGFGFSVIKIIDVNKDIINEQVLEELANKNNIRNNYVLTIIKLVIYDEKADIKNEKMYFIGNSKISIELIDTLKDVISLIIKNQFLNIIITKGTNYLEYHGTKKQLSRKKVAPLIESIVSEYNRFFYSSTINKYVARDFLEYFDILKDKFKLETKNNIIVNINYKEAIEIANFLNSSILTASEFFKVLKEAERLNDHKMVGSMKNQKIIEFLNTRNKDVKTYIKASPGLISLSEIDEETGLPSAVRKPNEYGNKELWRYWSFPDNLEEYVLTRSHIFLLNTSCLDGKVYINDRFPNLGFRLAREENICPKIQYEYKNNAIIVKSKTEFYDWKTIFKDEGFFEEGD